VATSKGLRTRVYRRGSRTLSMEGERAVGVWETTGIMKFKCWQGYRSSPTEVDSKEMAWNQMVEYSVCV
jgi:hypothetical protein